MKKNFTLGIALTICLISANAQNKTYFGIEFSIANSIYKIHDNGDYLTTTPLVDAHGGINVRREVTRLLFLETALLLKYYWEGFGFETIRYNGISSSDGSWLIPVRTGLRLNLRKEKWFFVPVVGYTFGINPPVGYGFGRGTSTSNTTVIKYNYTEVPLSSRYFSLLQTGAGFEFQLFRSFIVSISGNYYWGFKNLHRLDIYYTVNNANEKTGTATSKGEFWCVSTGVRYPISKFWMKK